MVTYGNGGALSNSHFESVFAGRATFLSAVAKGLGLHKKSAHKLAELERKIESRDAGIRTLFEAIHRLGRLPLCVFR